MRHNTIFEVSGGAQPPKAKFSTIEKPGYIRLYQIRDYGKSPVPIYIPKEDAKKTTDNGDILLARYGASLGKVFFAKKGAYNVAMAKVIPLYTGDWIDKQWLFLFYQSYLYQEVVLGNSRSAQAGFNKEDLRNLWIPIPPLAEQKRISEKYKSVLPLIAQYNNSEVQLNKLNNTFPEMLKKSVLQEAVMGKLVPQDESDEPASLLLERILEEKQRLIAEGKIKKDKRESIIYRRDNSHYEKVDGVERCIDDEIPFEIPESWEWVRLGTLFSHNTGKALNQTNKEGKLLDYITTSNLYWNRFELDSVKQMYFKESEIEKCTATKGDLLVCEGGDIGRAAIWNYDYDIRIQNHIHKLRPYIDICTEYYYYLFLLYKGAGLIGGKGIGIQGLSSNALHNILFPLPPVNEQRVIVQKIEQILSLSKAL